MDEQQNDRETDAGPEPESLSPLPVDDLEPEPEDTAEIHGGAYGGGGGSGRGY